MPENNYGFKNECLVEMVKKVICDLKLNDVKVHHDEGVKGAGYLSDVHRFALEGNTGKIHMIAKVKPQQKVGEESILETFWEIELIMYELVLPEFETIQKNLNVKLIWPRCYGVKRNGPEKVILLDDLAVQGYRMCRLGKSLDFSHATLTLQQLACLHAASFVFQRIQPNRFQKLLEERERIEKVFDFTDYMGPSVKFAEKSIDCEIFHRSLKKFCQVDFQEKVRYLMDGHNYKYAVITHGDMWANNLLFRYEGEIPRAAVLLDYQISNYSSPICDLYFMLFLAVDEATRDKHFMDLVNIYNEALREQITRLGQNPEDIYPKEQFDRDLQTFSYTGMGQTLFMLPIFANESDAVEKNIEEARGRKPVPGVTFMGVPLASEMYVSRVKQMAKDITKHGLDKLW